MNLSDEGKNRRPMAGIGLKGCRSVLEDLGLWHDVMKLEEARRILWGWSRVTEQKTRLEQLCYDSGIVLFYITKAHPIFSPIEVTLIHL
jgi:hypothetical protein